MRDILDREDIYLFNTKFINNLIKKKEFEDICKYFLTISNENKIKENMTSFWSNAIFYTGEYRGNPMKIFIKLSKKYKFDNKLFDSYIQIFNKTINQNFIGENAEMMKSKLYTLSQIIKINLKEKKLIK